MSTFYRLAYRLGFAPWEKASNHPPAARHVEALFAREEEGLARPFGRALDIGCGRGHWSIVLAEHGWEVTGVDIVRSAIRAARRRGEEAGVPVQFVRADITRLRSELALQSGAGLVREGLVREGLVGEGLVGEGLVGEGPGVAPFNFMWDFGTLHGLGRAALKSAAQELTAVAEREAVLLTLVWSPGRRGPLPRGLSQSELEAAFPEWRIVDVSDFDVSGLPKPLRGVGARFYRLQH